MGPGPGLFVCVDSRVVVSEAIEIAGALLMARLPVDGEKVRRTVTDLVPVAPYTTRIL